MNRLEIYQDDLALAEASAQRFIQLATETLSLRASFSVALSGGRGPQGLFRVLRRRQKELNWSRLEFFWVDERYVPLEDEESNCGNARRLLLDALVPPPHWFPMYIKGFSSSRAAQDYQAFLVDRFGEDGPFFDLCLLGMGPDGHTASLFPDQPSLEIADRLCLAVKHYQSGQERVTLSFPVINASKRVEVLLSGADKAKALAEIFGGHSRLPAARVQPKDSDLFWYCTVDAASLLPSPPKN